MTCRWDAEHCLGRSRTRLAHNPAVYNPESNSNVLPAWISSPLPA